jgi:hypothetical protein
MDPEHKISQVHWINDADFGSSLLRCAVAMEESGALEQWQQVLLQKTA